MITKSTGYTSSDGKFHSTLEEAQAAEISKLMNTLQGSNTMAIPAIEAMAKDIVCHSAEFIDILTMKPNSLPKARKINGGTKKRQPKHIAEQHTLPLTPAVS
jgi:hypothetical protein